MTDHLRIGRHPIRWHLAETVTAPRPTWQQAGRKRTRAPLTDAELEQRWNPGKPYRRKSHTYRRFANVYRGKDGTWFWRFTHAGKRHSSRRFATEDAAARAYNAYVEAHGFERTLLDVDDDLEAAS